MNLKDIACLPDCPDRSETCHSTCKRYKLREAANEIQRKKRQQERDSRTYMVGVRYQKATEEKNSGLVIRGPKRKWNTRQDKNEKGVK